MIFVFQHIISIFIYNHHALHVQNMCGTCVYTCVLIPLELMTTPLASTLQTFL